MINAMLNEEHDGAITFEYLILLALVIFIAVLAFALLKPFAGSLIKKTTDSVNAGITGTNF